MQQPPRRAAASARGLGHVRYRMMMMVASVLRQPEIMPAIVPRGDGNVNAFSPVNLARGVPGVYNHVDKRWTQNKVLGMSGFVGG